MQTTLRIIQLEIRAKNFMGAKILYEQVLNAFKDQTQIATFILIEYSEFLKTVLKKIIDFI